MHRQKSAAGKGQLGRPNYPFGASAALIAYPHSIVSDLSLGASWVFSFLQLLQSENRPYLPYGSAGAVWVLAAVT